MLTSEVKKMLNGANSRILSVITGRTAHEEAIDGSSTFNLVRAVRARRLQLLGHILRDEDQDRLLCKAIKLMYVDRTDGDKLEDAPRTSDW